MLALLERFGSPKAIRKAGRRRLVTLLRPKAPRMAERLVEDIFTALDEQTVVPGTEAAAVIVPKLAANLTALIDQRKELAATIETLLESHPLSELLTSMPGIGVRAASSHAVSELRARATREIRVLDPR